jgi:hypothetical protein
MMRAKETKRPTASVSAKRGGDAGCDLDEMFVKDIHYC